MSLTYHRLMKFTIFRSSMQIHQSEGRPHKKTVD